MVNIGVSTPSDTIDQITDFIERSPEILASIKEVFTKKSDARRAMEDK
jgi:hypothetical protein